MHNTSAYVIKEMPEKLKAVQRSNDHVIGNLLTFFISIIRHLLLSPQRKPFFSVRQIGKQREIRV